MSTMDMLDIEKVISQMTLEEKIHFVVVLVYLELKTIQKHVSVVLQVRL